MKDNANLQFSLPRELIAVPVPAALVVEYKNQEQFLATRLHFRSIRNNCAELESECKAEWESFYG